MAALCPRVHNLFAILGRTTFIFINCSRQCVENIFNFCITYCLFPHTLEVIYEDYSYVWLCHHSYNELASFAIFCLYVILLIVSCYWYATCFVVENIALKKPTWIGGRNVADNKI